MAPVVFLLTSGSHDDYTVRAICTSEASAERVAAEAAAAGEVWALRAWGNGSPYWDVSEWTLDALDGAGPARVIDAAF